MTAPNLTPEDVCNLFPEISDVAAPLPKTGQKQVFPCSLETDQFVLFFLRPEIPDEEQTELGSIHADSVYRRALREVTIMAECDTPHIPKLGPIDLQVVFLEEHSYICFSEEFIEGRDLKQILESDGALDEDELIKLAFNINEAISHLWAHDKIHRDIKPSNIMKRDNTGDFVLLDAGLAFDLSDASLTDTGFVPGTPGYQAPEQLDYSKKRETDNRADMFLIGVVLYRAATGSHPFIPPGCTDRGEINRNIASHDPPAPDTIRTELSTEFSQLVMRLLNKLPHLRFRSCDQLKSQLGQI